MLTIIGCGNPNRSDDGAGVAVIQRALERLGGLVPVGAQLVDAGTAGVEVMFRARGSRELVLVDACSSGSEPGAVFTVPGHHLERAAPPGHSLHGFRWEHALHAGKRIFRDDFPRQVTVYLIEAQSLELGLGFSPPVERAIEQVVGSILKRIAACSQASESRSSGGAAVTQDVMPEGAR